MKSTTSKTQNHAPGTTTTKLPPLSFRCLLHPFPHTSTTSFYSFPRSNKNIFIYWEKKKDIAVQKPRFRRYRTETALSIEDWDFPTEEVFQILRNSLWEDANWPTRTRQQLINFIHSPQASKEERGKYFGKKKKRRKENKHAPIGKPWILPSQTYSPLPEFTMVEDNTLRGTEVSPLNPEPAPPASAEALANLEKLSQGYEPEVTGPLVGELQSSKALEEQYAGADPAFVRKATALSQKYSHYRHVKGDGRCGWRALVFGYFELIMKSGDHNFSASEIERVTSLNNLLESAGHSSFLYEDFVEETIEVFRAITSSATFGGSYDDKPILDTFTNEEKSEAIVTHAKLLTSSYMKSCPEQYAPFLDEGMDIERFCSSKVDPVGAEMEHISANALIDCLILPAGFAVEIFYLDRSEGDEVNVYRFEKPAEGKSKSPEDTPVIRLLYRPGHYDLIYKNSDIEKLPSPIKEQPASIDVPPLTVGIARTLESDETRAFNRIFTELDGKFKFLLSTSHLHPSPELRDILTPSPQAQDIIPEILPPTQLSWSEDLPRTVLRKSSVMDNMPSNFRPSVFQFKAMEDVNFQTSSTQNSHNNTSHFQNENFQPEMYFP